MTPLEMKQAILEGLVASGWTAVDPVSIECTSAVAQKSFMTAVGLKTATARFTDTPAECCRLGGEYLSEGANALSATSVYVWYHLTPRASVCAGTLHQLAGTFAAAAEREIADTYAMRLMR